MMIPFLLALSAFVAASQQARCQTSDAPQSGALAIYRADGDALDSSGHDNYAEYLGTARYAPGLAGEAFDFDGEESYVTTPLRVSPDDVSDTTWTVWARPRRNDSRRLLLEADDAGFDRFITIENGFWGIGTGRGIWCPAEAKLGAWQHLAVVFARDSIRFYVNGQEYICPDAPVGQESQTKLRIGGSPLWKQFFDGLADEVEIYDRALDGEEIRKLYEKYSKDAGAIAPQALADANEPETQTGIAQADLTPITGPAEPTTPAPAEKAPETVSNSIAQEPQPTPVPMRTGIDGKASHVSSGAESPAVSAVGLTARAQEMPPSNSPGSEPQTENPLVAAAGRGELGRELLKSRWKPQAPNAVPTIDPQPINLASKLSAYRDKNVAILFWTPEFKGGWYVSEIINIEPLKVAQELSDQAKANKWKLEVVIVTNLPTTQSTTTSPLTAKELLAENGITLPFISDPNAEIRVAMSVYSTPLLLIDAKGNLIWKLRMGQRNSNTLETGDLMEAASALGTGKYRIGPSKTLGGVCDAGTPIFDFENGAEGWTLTGNAWGPEGTCSEKYYPGLVKGFLGRRWLSSFTGEALRGTGAAISPEFTITKRYLHLLVGGGDLSTRQGVALLCDGAAIKTATGENTYELKPVTWDLQPWMGKKLRLVAYDDGNSEMRDGIMLDAVTASDYPGLPKGFANRHDPDNATHVARVAADLPEEWVALQNGEFHMSAKPKRTFEATITFDVDYSNGSGPIRIVEKKLPSTPAQTVTDYYGELVIDGRSTRSTDVAGGWIKIEARRPARKNAKVQFIAHATITPSNLTMERGASPENPELNPYLKTRIGKIQSGDKYYAEVVPVLKREGLLRLPNETETAQLLRAWRWLQRSWTDGAPWGGWPTPNPTTPTGLAIQKSMSCPSVGVFTDTARSDGRPATGGQGYWANSEGGTCPPHFRALIPLEKAGWVLLDDDKWVNSAIGQFRPGRETGDTYFQITYWPESKDHETPPGYTNVKLSCEKTEGWTSREKE